MSEHLVNFHLDDKIKQELDILAKREGRTLKEIFTELVDDYLKIHKEGNPQHLMSSYLENTEFDGFPSIAIDRQNKEKWFNLESIQDKDITRLFWHIQEYKTILESRGFSF